MLGMSNDRECLVWRLRGIVREAAYNVVRLDPCYGKGEEYSRAKSLYVMACDTLRDFDPDADQYIRETYQV